MIERGTRYLAVDVVADTLSVSEDYVRTLVKRGHLEGFKLPGGRNAPIRISEESVQHMLQSCRLGSEESTAFNQPQPTQRPHHRQRRAASAEAWGV